MTSTEYMAVISLDKKSIQLLTKNTHIDGLTDNTENFQLKCLAQG
jgi:hypothetical protein